MTKKIFLIIQESRVAGSNDSWNTPIAIYAVKTFKQALIDCKKNNHCNNNDKYLQFRYRIEIITMYD